MRRKRHTPEQVVRKLREAEAALAAETSLDQACKRLGINEASFNGKLADELLNREQFATLKEANVLAEDHRLA